MYKLITPSRSIERISRECVASYLKHWRAWGWGIHVIHYSRGKGYYCRGIKIVPA